MTLSNRIRPLVIAAMMKAVPLPQHRMRACG